MTLWPTMLALMAPTVAVAAPDAGDATATSGRIQLPPVRLGTRVGMRSGAFPAALMEAGVEAVHTTRVTGTLYGAYETPMLLQLPSEFPRDHSWAELSAELLFHPSDLVGIGPVAGVGLRTLRQQWWPIARQVLPTAGATLQLEAFRRRTWGVAIVSRATVDLVDTRLVLDTQEVVPMPRLEVQAGVRVLLGHGRAR